MITETTNRSARNLLKPKYWRQLRESRLAEQMRGDPVRFIKHYRQLTDDRFAGNKRTALSIDGFADSELQTRVDELRSRGFTKWEGLFTDSPWLQNACAEMHTHIDRWQDAFSKVDADCRSIGDRTTGPVMNRMNFSQDGRARISFSRIGYASPAFADLMRHDALGEIVSRYFDSDAHCNYLLAERLHTAQRGDFWHIDRIIDQVKIMVLLTDVDSANGPIRYKTATHRGIDSLEPIYYQIFASGVDYAYPPGPLVEKLDSETVLGTGKAGDVFIFDTLGVHSGMQCISGHRDALVATFTGGTCKTRRLKELSEGRWI